MTPRKTLLITGASGFLGRALAETARQAGWRVVGTYFTHPITLPGTTMTPLDIRDRDAVVALCRATRPDVVIHTAYRRGTERFMAGSIVQGSAHVAAAANETGARLIHISSDVVFDGEKGWYREDDPVAPVHDYGRAKAAAEDVIRQIYPAAVIVRTSLIIDPVAPDQQSAWIWRSIREHTTVTLFSDEYRCPVHRDDLVRALLFLAKSDFSGVLHVAGTERVSRYEIGLTLAAWAGLSGAGILLPGKSRASGRMRPRDCSLDCRRARNLLPFPLRGFQAFMAKVTRSK